MILRFASSFAAAATMASAALPAQAQAILSAGQEVRGSLDPTDPKLSDDSHFDCYSLVTNPGTPVTVTMRAPTFDAYLAIGAGKCSAGSAELTNDDMLGGGTDSQITFTPDSGSYWIRPNSLLANTTGGYSLSVSSGDGGAASNGTSARTPAGLSRPAEGLRRLIWDQICVAADTYWTINSGEPADEAGTQRLNAAMTETGASLGKSFEETAEGMFPLFEVYLADPNAFHEQSAAATRAMCLQALTH